MSKKHSGWELKEAASRLHKALPKDSDKLTFEAKFIEVVGDMLSDYVKRHDENIFVRRTEDVPYRRFLANQAS